MIYISKRNRKAIGIISILFLGLSWFCSYQLGLAACSILLIFLGLQKMLSSSIFDSNFMKLITAICIYAGMLQVTTLLVWIINVNFPLNQIIPMATILSIFLFVSSGAIYTRRTITRKRTPSFYKADAVSIAISLFILALLVIPPLKDANVGFNHSFYPNTITDHIGMATDDANHVGMIVDKLNSNRGVLYKSDAVNILTEPAAITSYPAGWHSANAALIMAFDPGIQNGGEAVVTYIISKLFWFFVLIYLFVRITFTLAKFISFKPMSASTYYYLIAFLCFFTYYSLINHYKEGFYTFVPQLIASMLAALILTQLWQDIKAKSVDEATRLRSMTALVYVISLGALSWFLVAPALIFAALFPLLVSYRVISKRFIWTLLKSHGLAILSCALAILLQVFLITSSGARDPGAGITETGAIAQFSSYYYIFIITGTLASLKYMNNKSSQLNGFMSLVAMSLALSFVIALYQTRTLGHIEYYFFKPLATAVILLMPIAFIGWAYILDSLTHKTNTSNKLIIATIVTVSLPLVIGFNPINTSHLQYVLGNRGFSTQESIEIYNIIASRPISRDVIEDEIVIGFIPNNASYGVYTSNLLDINARKVNKCQAQLYRISVIPSTTSELIGALGKCKSSDGRIIILTRSISYGEIQQALLSTNMPIQPSLKRLD